MKYNVKLVKLPSKVLRKKSKDIPIPLRPEDIELAETMIYHIDDSQTEGTMFQPGVGVAAVQYGILKNMFYINTAEIDPLLLNKQPNQIKDVFINPKIIAKSDFKISLEDGEGCLSVGRNIAGQEGYVYRANRIVFEAYSYTQKKVVRMDLEGYLAIVAQHELDHLEGKLFIDRINKKNPWNVEPNSRLLT
ncbi:peptide deformylase [Mycoplasma zalophidermidis]|uniref:Peptide deformylase n=1 Tax=Mycoplasma zalophidermidis TaxID=398174 RepID=A0ABS6DR22_9MOLU|nr:peptide deformylase [Mycoplasma zalophidermidis]MBU4689550.1 peptide deformylase [Mycoplasma zalophidermidis]MBU4693447.1 peptide deformylase [Mycoplasma zalophidermidis]MCR8966275.1 peptide deformylase [Mycoplasma zalophidermidis]